MAHYSYINIFNASPVYTGGWVRKNLVTMQRSVRSIDDDSIRIMFESHWFDDESTSSQPSFPLEIVKPIAVDISPSGTSMILLKHTGKEADNPVIEIRQLRGGDHAAQSQLLSCKELHGKFVGDSWFGGISWSSCERYVAYVANRKREKQTTYFDENSNGKSTKFSYIEDWGEKYDSVSETVVCVVDTLTSEVFVMPRASPLYTSSGQPKFQPFTSRLSFTAWKTSPIKLGMIYCYNRASSIYITENIQSVFSSSPVTACNFSSTTLPAPGTFPSSPSSPSSSSSLSSDLSSSIKIHKLTEGLAISRSPRFSPDGTRLIFLGSRNGFSTHNGCSELFSLKFHPTDSNVTDDMSSRIEVIIEEVRQVINHTSFPGLFVDQLPRDCFLSSDIVVLSSLWGSRETIITVNLTDKKVSRINPLQGSTIFDLDDEWNQIRDYSASIIDVQNGKILFVTSSPNFPQRVGLHDMSSCIHLFSNPIDTPVKILPARAAATFCAHPSEALSPSKLMNIRWKIIKALGPDGIPFEGLLLLPPHMVLNHEGSVPPVSQYTIHPPLPLIVVPHGGPHSNLPTSFFAAYAFLVLHLNVGVLHCNYRGSTGFGKDSVESLCGNIAKSDVEDCVTLTKMCIDQGYADEHNLAVVGGSHGGFLAAHLLGQYPNMFKAAALRNPVFDIPSMVGVTDIPDWCFVESSGINSYNFSSVMTPTPEIMDNMMKKSPSFYIESMKTPCLICLGMKDRRVPSSQGILMYNMLRTRGIQTVLLSFPDDVHAIDRPASEAEHWCAIAEFLAKYLVRVH